MKNKIFIISAIICLLASNASAQHRKTSRKSEHTGWEIIYKKSTVTPPDISDSAKANIEEKNKRAKHFEMRDIISEEGYKTIVKDSIGLRHVLIINKKIKRVFNGYRWGGDTASLSLKKYVQLFKNNPNMLKDLHIDKEKQKKILGYKTVKENYYLLTGANSEDTLRMTTWNTLDLPDWYNRLGYRKPLKGVPLKILITEISDDNHKSMSILLKAVSLKKIVLNDSTFLPGKVYKSIAKNISVTFGQPPQKPFFNKAKQDSLSEVVEQLQKDHPAQAAASIFQNGFARISNKDTADYYIDSRGHYLFNSILDQFHPIDSITQAGPGYVYIHRNKKESTFIVSRKGKIGLLNDRGKWLLSPDYDAIKVVFNRYLKLIKNGKMGYANTKGQIMLPAKFDEANIMDGQNYFDVKKDDEWGVYNAKQGKMVIPFAYNKFDYCGGCGGEVPYAYASKNGKWGVINFKDSVLVPFAYDHPGHWGMRGDNWVTSFEKDSAQVVINMNTGQVYSAKEYERMRVISGVLALKKNGKYEIINAEGKQLFDFDFDVVTDPYDHFHWGPLLLVYKNNKAGIVTNTGKVIITPNQYDKVLLEGDYFVVYKNKKAGLLDSTGKQILPCRYKDISGRYGMSSSNKTGKKVHLFEVEKGDSVGFFNPQNGALVNPHFTGAAPVLNKDSTQIYVQVKTALDSTLENFKYGLYSLSGTELMPSEFTHYQFLTDNLVKVTKNDKRGIVL